VLRQRIDPSDEGNVVHRRVVHRGPAVLDRFDVEVFAGERLAAPIPFGGRRAIDSGRVTLPTDEEEFAVVGTTAIGTAVGRRAQ